MAYISVNVCLNSVKNKQNKQVGIEHFIERKIILQTPTTTTTLSAGRVGWDWSHILCGEETFILVQRGDVQYDAVYKWIMGVYCSLDGVQKWCR